MSLNPLPQPKSLFIAKPQGGAVKEGRASMSGGTYMDIGSLVTFSKSHTFAKGTNLYDFSRKPFTSYEFVTELKTFIPLDILCRGMTDERSEALKHIGRLEALSWWQLSYQEIIRHIIRMDNIAQTEFFTKCKQLADHYQDEIHQLVLTYLKKIETHGDWSFEQYKYYVTEHEDSRSPFVLGTQGVKWGHLLENENLLRRTWSDVSQKLHQLISEYDSLVKQFGRPLIDGSHIYPALRHRLADYSVISMDRQNIIVKAITSFNRKAGGVPILSQCEFPVYGRKEIKDKVYEHFYEWMKKVLGITDTGLIFSISIDGMDFYKQLLTGSWTCADLSNAEKQVAQIVYKSLFNSDLSIPTYGVEYPGELNSGIGPTKIFSEIVSVLYLLILKEEYGLKFMTILFGGDNLALKESNIKEILSNMTQYSLGVEDRVLGFNPELKRFWPLNLVTDNPKHSNNLPGLPSEVKQVQTRQYELRPLQTVVQNSLYLEDSCTRFIEWACENAVFKDAMILDKNHFEEILMTEQFREPFIEKFSDELNWLKSYIPTTTNPEEPTNLRKQVF